MNKDNEDGKMIQDHMGIICKLALQYWPCLPTNAKVAFDLEDMIEDIVLQLLKALPKYSPERGKQSTFVWSVARGHCIYLMSHFNCKSRNTIITSIDVEEARNLSTQEQPGYASREAVERVIEHSSDDLRRVLELLFNGNLGGIDGPLVEEFRSVAKKHNACYNDFLFVLQMQTA